MESREIADFMRLDVSGIPRRVQVFQDYELETDTPAGEPDWTPLGPLRFLIDGKHKAEENPRDRYRVAALSAGIIILLSESDLP